MVDKPSDRLLGATIMGPHATDLIHELGLALLYGISVREVGLMIHAHPTVAEAVMDAAHDVARRRPVRRVRSGPSVGWVAARARSGP